MSKVEMAFDDHWQLREAIKTAKELIADASHLSRSELIKYRLDHARQYLESALARKFEIKK